MTDDTKLQLDELRKATTNVERAKKLLSTTQELRFSIKYDSYQEMLTAEPYLANPVLVRKCHLNALHLCRHLSYTTKLIILSISIQLRLEINLRLEQILNTDERKIEFERMFQKLHTLYCGTDTEYTEVQKLKNISELEKNLVQNKYASSKNRLIVMQEVCAISALI